MKGEIFEDEETGEVYYVEGNSIYRVDFAPIHDLENDHEEQLIELETEKVEWEALNEDISKTRKQLHELAEKQGITLEKTTKDLVNDWRERINKKQQKEDITSREYAEKKLELNKQRLETAKINNAIDLTENELDKQAFETLKDKEQKEDFKLEKPNMFVDC